jgi:histidinol-phosphate/aromatic aminotransferase/cobyric acid decarboxylase-like protein
MVSREAVGIEETSFAARALPLTISVATGAEREEIYRIRHRVYAEELEQHRTRGDGRLSDPTDEVNLYLRASEGPELVGFVSLTPPGNRFSLDKYRKRADLPFQIDARTWEVRLLTVVAPHRRRSVALLLAWAALRWVQAHAGTVIVGMGRNDLLEFYGALGLASTGIGVRSGAVDFEIVCGEVETLAAHVAAQPDFLRILDRSEPRLDWRLPISFRNPASCFHGGAFFEAIGEDFARLERRREIVNADVLDAWFPPAPGVLEALRNDLAWTVRTSPPTSCRGMVRAVAQARGVAEESILPGAGSSDLIFLAFRHWLSRGSRALILDPMYGEYAHVLEKVIGCRVERFPLSRKDGYRVDPARLEKALSKPFDLVALVNPNSPTGCHVPRDVLQPLLASASARRIWIDETYVDYAGAGESLERFAAASENVVVCKSMSKVYALSGVRAAYLCASPAALEDLRAVTPPWAVSLPGQIAAVRALADPGYYAARWIETAHLREELAEGLRHATGAEVVPGVANFLLCHLPESGPGAADVVRECRERGLFVRDASSMGAGPGPHAVRVAVKDRATNARMLEVFGGVVRRLRSAPIVPSPGPAPARGNRIREALRATSGADSAGPLRDPRAARRGRDG